MNRNDEVKVKSFEEFKLQPIGHAISGADGSTIASLFIYPLDISTIRLQLNNDKKDKKGILHTIYDIYQQEGGLKALYAGLGSDTVATVLSNFIYFYCYTALRNLQEKLNRSMGKQNADLNIAQELFLGSEAALISRFSTTPVSNMTIHLQSSSASRSADSCSKYITTIAIDPFHPITLGYRASIILVTNPSITYFVFERLKRIYTNNNCHTLNSFQIFLLPALSKSIATIITYPFILLRTTMINDQHQQKHNTSAKVGSSSMVATYRKVVNENGYLGLYRGMRSQILKGFFNQGIMYMIKDYLANYLKLLFYYQTFRKVKPLQIKVELTYIPLGISLSWYNLFKSS
ncbi:mitochondrial carrier domain-containing protein [Mycotypha africana]|uniref:mitochondrial carrier domain-containing protein n=1 Tax=Mycotypha africana TaxID=64632 RepID=UPI002300490B|nr:mitochondrial carrier domain-containing protein [Mycotypha africana]KAI8968419.1 mitochondrial carrier domain-containing protein [Mycotypha africana]